MSNPYVGDVGTAIRLETNVDISSGTPSVKVKKPDGTTATWTGGNTTIILNATTGVNSIVEHILQAGELDQHGVWSLQAYVLTTGLGFTGHGETAKMTVMPLFDE